MACMDKCSTSRFLSKVDAKSKGECWPWMGAKNKLGYGKFKHLGTVLNASRVALAIKMDQPLFVLHGLAACHTCDNPECCNPDHLYAGTQSQNMRDRWKRTGFKSNRLTATSQKQKDAGISDAFSRF